jgi:hypothetical protein
MFLMMAMMGGNSPFGQLFGTPTTTAPVATPVQTVVVTDELAADTQVVTDEPADYAAVVDRTEA